MFEESLAKQNIESLLSQYATFSENNSCDFSEEGEYLNTFWEFISYSILGRAAYESISCVDQGDDFLKKYASKKEKQQGGIPVDLTKISNAFWVPKSYLDIKQSISNDFFRSFEIFDQDQLNCFPYKDKYGNDNKLDLLKKILYCENLEGLSIGEKKDLFLYNSDWRADAKLYAFTLLEGIQFRCIDPKEDLNMMVDFKSNLGQKTLQGIKYITALYLDEMK